jgi:hypothetical protein
MTTNIATPSSSATRESTGVLGWLKSTGASWLGTKPEEAVTIQEPPAGATATHTDAEGKVSSWRGAHRWNGCSPSGHRVRYASLQTRLWATVSILTEHLKCILNFLSEMLVDPLTKLFAPVLGSRTFGDVTATPL